MEKCERPTRASVDELLCALCVRRASYEAQEVAVGEDMTEKFALSEELKTAGNGKPLPAAAQFSSVRFGPFRCACRTQFGFCLWPGLRLVQMRTVRRIGPWPSRSILAPLMLLRCASGTHTHAS